LRTRLIVLWLLLLGIGVQGWSQEAKFVPRPTEEAFSITGIASIGGIKADKNGTMYVTSGGVPDVRIYRPDGTLESSFGHRIERYSEEDPHGFVDLKGLSLDKDGNMYISEGRGQRIRVFNSLGEPLLTINMPEFLIAIMSPSGERIYMPGYPAEAKKFARPENI